MSKASYLFTTWEGGGNVTPAIEAARKLVARGHDVRFMSEACNRNEAEACGADFVSWKRAPNRQTRDRATERVCDWAAATPQEGLLGIIRDLWCGPSLQYAEDVIEELRREPADLVVTCEALFGVMAGCESMGQPFAILAPNISLAPLPGVPPLGPGLAPARSDADRAMHAQIAAAMQQITDSGLPPLNAAREALGLRPLAHTFDQFQAAEVELLATSAAFDFPAERLPERVRYVGPQIADPRWTGTWTSPWPQSDARPLVVVGFSTTFQNHAGVLRNVIGALTGLPVRALVTCGGSIDLDELPVSDNCVVVESAPHTVVMREAAVVVTHGGHGTVMRALVNRVPTLVMPHGRDQADNAVRVTERGAGLSLAPAASVDEIRAAVRRLLEEEAFRAGARRLGDQVAAHAERSTVVEELERAALGARCSQ